jgi:chromosome segregation ATPase
MAFVTAQVLFNQLSYIDRLTRGGFTPEQARASAEALETAFTESVATKGDLAELKAELKQEIGEVSRLLTVVKAELEQEIGEVSQALTTVKAELRTEIAGVRSEIASVRTEIATVRTEIATVRTEIAQSKNDVLRWMFAFNLALVGAIFGILKFVH